MKQTTTAKRLSALLLSLTLLLLLAACGGQSAPAQEAGQDQGPSETLKGIYEALIAPDSAYSQNKAAYGEYYPELEYTETLLPDRITLTLHANGNEFFSDGSWDFVEDGDRLTAVIRNDDTSGIFNVFHMANAIGAYYGMETELINGYLNGLGTLGIESDNLRMTQDEAAGTTAYSLNISGPWDMQELSRMVIDETVVDAEPLGADYTSQGAGIGKLRMVANGNADSYTVLLAEYGALDDAAYQSIVNLVTLRRPAGWEAFLGEFTALQELESAAYAVDLAPSDETVQEMMGERNEKYSYVLVRFGAEGTGGTEEESFVPLPETIAMLYFRPVAGIPRGVAGSSLRAAQKACDVLAFAVGNELWMADIDTLRANMLEAWESLTDEERAEFDENFPGLNELLNGCFEDWDANRGRFEDAGVLETMEELLSQEATRRSWETLSANTWTLGNDG